MNKEDKEILLTTVKCIINFFYKAQEIENEEEYNREINKLSEAANELLIKSRNGNFSIPKEDREVLYKIIH